MTASKQWMAFTTGLVTIVALAALGVLVVLFGDLRVGLGPRREYVVTFKDALGAEPRVPVRRAGLRIGEITQVRYDEDRSLGLVTIVLEDQNFLREGDEPRLARGLIGGDTFIDIDTRPELQGVKDRPRIPVGSEIAGRSPLDLSSTGEQAVTIAPNANKTLEEMQRTMSKWGETADRANKLLATNEQNLNAILRDTRSSVDRLNTALQNINNTLDPPTQENFKRTVANLSATSEDLRPLVRSANDAIVKIRDTATQLDAVAANLQTATKPLAERSDSTVKNLDEASKNLNLLLVDLQIVSRKVSGTDSTVGRLVNDPKLYQNLDDAAVLLQKNMAELNYVLQDLKVFSDKIARHPGALGVQGALTRDQGTKDVPPSQLAPYRR